MVYGLVVWPLGHDGLVVWNLIVSNERRLVVVPRWTGVIGLDRLKCGCFGGGDSDPEWALVWGLGRLVV